MTDIETKFLSSAVSVIENGRPKDAAEQQLWVQLFGAFFEACGHPEVAAALRERFVVRIGRCKKG